ncbi:MAG TPA: T9SS type A sorting domain-containing protein [Mucilaginibacter sp.]|jgi:hypothetical protein|nr:T9SS type A sorting domain-containing protein [Mucilaginibacter sp.]
MRRAFTFFNSWVLIIAMAIFMNYASATPIKQKASDTISYYLLKKKQKKSLLPGMNLSIPPIKPNTTSTAHVVPATEKLLSNVEVYPNPVITDQINLKYMISRNSNVTIKMVDVLGNEVMTLFSQRVEPGEQMLNRSISSKINRGFYFIRVIAGTESVIKRITLL